MKIPTETPLLPGSSKVPGRLRPLQVQVITLLNFYQLTHHTQTDSVKTYPRYVN
ncbi:hypothetical protein CROQUDRAFT_90421 [Cronartium quercuum f. sp. fusiforme G11]|uniref:Uncharacterized protein n=1 Tax=Cronartium quercuum f. sp. fusiforme G11 TaxID=708437 RepID=A0A9P6TE21_9BASI|nr:hypothetical protein CROQUDRAFT_90421 [Cronartium quercuum f. sp. fusiforme G11]